jgi:hypothetical protein
LGSPVLSRQGPFAEQPALRTGLVATGAVDAQPTRHTLRTAVLRVKHGYAGPPLGRHGGGQLLAGMQGGDLHGMRMEARAPSSGVWLG